MSLLLAMEGWDVGAWRSRFERMAPDLQPVTHTDNFDPGAIRYACVWNAPAGLLGRLDRLEALFSLGAGVDHLMRQPDLPDVPLVRIVDDSLTNRMTEWVVLQVLTHHRRQLDYLRQQRARLWQEHAHPMAREIHVGIMGMGVLGTASARALSALGYKVAGWSRTQRAVDGAEMFHGDGGLGDFLARTDILVSLLPLTPETEGLIDHALLSRLRRDNRLGGACLVNAGRGKVQVEADILRALDEGILRGCSLDVFETEPLPADSPLWTHPRVTITPHAAATSVPQALIPPMIAQMDAFDRGEPLKNLVDREAGY